MFARRRTLRRLRAFAESHPWSRGTFNYPGWERGTQVLPDDSSSWGEAGSRRPGSLPPEPDS